MPGKIYVPNINFDNLKPQLLFSLCRPFLMPSGWGNDVNNFKTWNIQNDNIEFTDNIKEANIALIPFSINDYDSKNEWYKIKELSQLCEEYEINAYGFIGGDFGKHYPELNNIIYLRSGGFKSRLNPSNKGIAVFLGDHYARIFKTAEISLREKKAMPYLSFCGHATLSPKKRAMENLKAGRENLKRIAQGDFILEPLFPSAFHRASLLNLLGRNRNIRSNFIFRSEYRGGAQSKEQRENTTFEYYHNIVDSDYVFCLRGGGNFSVRFYETMMCGRIPLFINTDCLLPQEDKIDWKKHVVWVEWGDRQYIAERLMDFHNEIHPDDFRALQLENRELWKKELSVSGTLKYLLL